MCLSDDELVVDVVQHRNIARKEVAAKVLKEQRLTPKQFLTRKLLTIFNQYLQLGGINQDGREKFWMSSTAYRLQYKRSRLTSGEFAT